MNKENNEKKKPWEIRYCDCGHRLSMGTTKRLNGKLVCSFCEEDIDKYWEE